MYSQNYGGGAPSYYNPPHPPAPQPPHPHQGYPPQQAYPYTPYGHQPMIPQPMSSQASSYHLGDPYMSTAPALSSNIGGPGAEDYFKGFHDGTVQSSGAFNTGSMGSWLGPMAANLVLFLVPVWFIRRRMMAQTAAGGKAPGSPQELMEMFNPLKTRDFKVEVRGTSFKDVIGIDEAKEEVKQYVDFLKEPTKYTRLGGRLPKGCLLTGKPGTGKTLLAKAVAGEANVPFFSCSGADFIEVFGGSGPKRVRELFAAARGAGTCVVFIDEIDAIGSRAGGKGMGGVSSEENRTINQLLSELDGMQSSDNIIVLAATNFAENIDKALTREGRFDRKVTIPMPDQAARRDLFNFYLQKVMTGDPESKVLVPKVPNEADKTDKTKEAENKQPETIPTVIVEGIKNFELSATLAERTPGVSPAQIATIVNEAALTAAVAGQRYVPLTYLQDAIDDVLIGKKHRQRMSDLALRRTAYHEAGHCIAAWLSPLQKDVIKLSVIPRGRAGGYTQQVQEEALDPQTNKFLFSTLCVLSAGRVAEQIAFGDVSIGAMDDLQRATKIAVDKLILYGMAEGGAGQLSFKHDSSRSDGRGWMPFSEKLHADVEQEAKKMVDRAFLFTETLLTEKKDKLVALSEMLLKERELDRAAIEAVLGPRPRAT